jgi:hypothetical protein
VGVVRARLLEGEAGRGFWVLGTCDVSAVRVQFAGAGSAGVLGAGAAEHGGWTRQSDVAGAVR